MIKTIVIDLDGTLCDDNHRIVDLTDPIGSFKMDPDKYFEKIHCDSPHEDVLWLLRNISGMSVILLTCRPEAYRVPTEKWLFQNRVLYTHLIMRHDGDETPSDILKIRSLENHFRSKEQVLQNVLFVLEDRDKVVKAFREYGLSCWQVRDSRY